MSPYRVQQLIARDASGCGRLRRELDTVRQASTGVESWVGTGSGITIWNRGQGFGVKKTEAITAGQIWCSDCGSGQVI